MGAIAKLRAFLDDTVEFARRRPGTVLAWVLGLHVVVWTVVPILTSSNLQLDLLEDLALGREWQLGYWKHPPLPWWLADLVYRVTGQINAVYVLGPLAAAVCFYGMWLLARDTLGEFEGLIAVLALEAIHFYNYSVVKFAHDQMQLPFWAFTGLLLWRAIVRGRSLDWILAGVLLAGAFWSKYTAFALAATLGLVLLLDPYARRAWRTPGPYLMALAFAVVAAPHVWWLIEHDFLPFRYLDGRAVPATKASDAVRSQLRFFGSQWGFVQVTLVLLALLYIPGWPRLRQSADDTNAFNRRYVTALALGPFLATIIVAIVLARRPLAMWGYPFWTFLPLAVLMWLQPQFERAHLRRFAAGAMIVLLAMPIAFVLTELAEPLIRDRQKATEFPGRLLAETITQRWREKTGTPLSYVSGITAGEAIGRETPGWWEFPANNIAVYSPDRPHVVVHGKLEFSPWIDPADLDRRGVVIVWRGAGNMEELRKAFPRAEIQESLALPWLIAKRRPPDIVNYAIVPPRP